MILWNTLIRFDKSKVIPGIALRNTLGVAIPLVLGAVLGQPAGGLIAAIGAMNVSYSDGYEPYRIRATRMLTATVCVSLAVAAGGLLGREHAALVAAAGLAALLAGMMGAVNQTAADLGVTTLATLIVFAAQSMTAVAALQSCLLAFGGGLLQTGLAVASWPTHRYAPERRALATLFAALSREAEAGTQGLLGPDLPPPASFESTEAQRVLAALAGDSSLEADRCLALLSQAERMRLALLAIARLRVRLAREPDGGAEAEILDDSLAAAARALNMTGEVLLPGSLAPNTNISAEIARIEADSERLRDRGRAMSRDASRQLDALTGQIRSTADIAFHSTPAGAIAFEAAQAAVPRPLRFRSGLARIRANLNFNSAVFRHAVRMAGCVALAEAINRIAGSRRGYWLPMTVAIILRPDFTTTIARGVLRLAGTLIGLMAATGLIYFLAPARGVEILLIAAFTFLMRCFGPANYGIFAISLTGLVVFLIAITGVAPGPVMVARGLNTLAGGAIALAAYALWPTWERNLVPERLADLVDAYRQYFDAVRDGYLFPGPEAQIRLDRTRNAARLARSNAEASVTRLSSEPGLSEERKSRVQKLIANSHRLVLAIMSLEAGIASSSPAPVRESFRAFADKLDRTLSALSGALRGGKIDRSTLPDLREAHRELTRSGDPHFGRYALVNIETDRIVNSLNTLVDLVASVKF